MLPVVAAMVMGAMARNATRASGAGGSVLDMLVPVLDRDRDGSVVDDVAGMLGKMLVGR